MCRVKTFEIHLTVMIDTVKGQSVYVSNSARIWDWKLEVLFLSDHICKSGLSYSLHSNPDFPESSAALSIQFQLLSTPSSYLLQDFNTLDLKSWNSWRSIHGSRSKKLSRMTSRSYSCMLAIPWKNNGISKEWTFGVFWVFIPSIWGRFLVTITWTPGDSTPFG